jgi:hypothetical protein
MYVETYFESVHKVGKVCSCEFRGFRGSGWPGTDVMIFKIFSPKNLAKKLAFFVQTTANFWKNCDHNIGFWEKRQFFRRKLSKIAENCDHNIDPRLGKISPIMRSFPLGTFWKLQKYPNFGLIWLLFSTENDACYFLFRKWVLLHLAPFFFANSSGHPVADAPIILTWTSAKKQKIKKRIILAAFGWKQNVAYRQDWILWISSEPNLQKIK